MNIQMELLDNYASIRAAFVNKFLPASYMDSANESACSRFMWDYMPKSDYPSVSFAVALNLLRSCSGDVIFMSEESTHLIGRCNAKPLSDLIEFEWMENARLFAEERYLADAILPEDLYVFTPEMDRMLVFTHETSNYEAELNEDYLEQAQSRVCIAYGFGQQ
jgi:hypothetical protein